MHMKLYLSICIHMIITFFGHLLVELEDDGYFSGRVYMGFIDICTSILNMLFLVVLYGEFYAYFIPPLRKKISNILNWLF